MRKTKKNKALKESKKKNKSIKKSAQNVDVINLENDDKNLLGGILKRGEVEMLDLVFPSGIDRSEQDCLRLGDKYVRNFVLTGYPKQIYVGWMDRLLHDADDMDVALYIDPADERDAIDELTRKITQFESQLSIEEKQGSNKNITRLQNAISELYTEREKIELNSGGLYYTQIAFNLFANDKNELNKRTKILENYMSGRKIKIMPTFLQQDVGYKTVLPLGRSYLKQNYRNFSADALTACFPFYNNEISHKSGVYMGVNVSTMTPIYLDLFDRKLLTNGNMTIFGRSGIGKTFFVSLILLRSALVGIRTVIIDPEGEYKKLTSAVHGSIIDISPGSGQFINAFDIEDEDILDGDGKPTGVKEVRIKDKISDVLNLVAIMAGGLSSEERSYVSAAIADTYKKFGITEEPGSIYSSETYYDEETEELKQGGIKKIMPRFSDFWENLRNLAEEKKSENLNSLVNTLTMYKQGGAYDLFDCYTSEELMNFKDSPIIDFDVSGIEDDILRPIGMYITTSWTWEKFCKKNPYLKKIVMVDEAWLMTNKNVAGHEFTSKFLEVSSRRIRKRKGSLIVGSQNFKEFVSCSEGEAVLTNATVNVFFRQNSMDVDEIQSLFKLSDGESGFLFGSGQGEFLIRMDGKSTIGYASSFDFERELIEKKALASE